ncbi:hypothetical protein FRX31_017257 [Thalictrum thalictroides]|uniref:Uncharacterized protein n=1 Tax=Thalictrum thalictroides TaxID=46969 RepID=A0A7J6W8A0_THATH|nr:hypothetical protein FRX31_017257 [Thalictrum thalictroides]
MAVEAMESHGAPPQPTPLAALPPPTPSSSPLLASSSAKEHQQEELCLIVDFNGKETSQQQNGEENKKEEPAKPWTSLLKNPPPSAGREELSYTIPMFENGKLVVDDDLLEEGAKEWEAKVVGFFLDKKLPFTMVKNMVEKKWKLKSKVDLALDGDMYYFTFHNEEDREQAPPNNTRKKTQQNGQEEGEWVPVKQTWRKKEMAARKETEKGKNPAAENIATPVSILKRPVGQQSNGMTQILNSTGNKFSCLEKLNEEGENSDTQPDPNTEMAIVEVDENKTDASNEEEDLSSGSESCDDSEYEGLDEEVAEQLEKVTQLIEKKKEIQQPAQQKRIETRSAKKTTAANLNNGKLAAKGKVK